MGRGDDVRVPAVGAIPTFAVHVQTTGFSVHTAGIILMIVGIAGARLHPGAVEPETEEGLQSDTD
jgi:hypothetical protein